MEEKDSDRAVQSAIDSFGKMKEAAESKDPKMAADAFYRVVTETYRMATKEDLFERDYPKIITALKDTQGMMTLMLLQEEWDTDSIEAFEEEVKKQWIIDDDLIAQNGDV